MNTDFWAERWATQQIGFHLPQVNPRLIAHHGVLPPGGRVLVPLCGKSVDMVWLVKQGHTVVGVELVETAIEAFFRDQALPFEIDTSPPRRYRSGALTLTSSDILALEAKDVGPIDCVWDRAALVALPVELRPVYARLLARLAPGAPMLLVTLEHDLPGGPPYAVDIAEVRTLFGDANVELLQEDDVLPQSPNMASKGAKRVVERTYKVKLG